MSTTMVFCPREELEIRECGCSFVPWKRLRWLERRFRRLWEWLSAPVFQKIRHHTISFSPETDILKAIYQNDHNIELIAGRKCRHVVVGANMYPELKYAMSPMSYHVDATFGHDGHIYVYGLQVHVVPWFDGVLLLPDWDDIGGRARNTEELACPTP